MKAQPHPATRCHMKHAHPSSWLLLSLLAEDRNIFNFEAPLRVWCQSRLLQRVVDSRSPALGHKLCGQKDCQFERRCTPAPRARNALAKTGVGWQLYGAQLNRNRFQIRTHPELESHLHRSHSTRASNKIQISVQAARPMHTLKPPPE